MRGKSCSPGPRAKRRILIVEDHPLVRRGLTALIDNEPDLTVCAAAAGQQAGLDAIAVTRPDLVVADLSLGEGDGLSLLKDIRLRHRELPVLVLTMHDAPLWAGRAFRAGARGFVTKQELGETLLIAIRSLLDGGRFASPKARGELETK